MGENTNIEWTEATWNPIRGCSRVSEGCRNCYAERVAMRFSGPGQPYEGLATKTNGHPQWTGVIRFVEEHLSDPLKWKTPRRIFVNSMSDIFHEAVTDEQIDQIFAVMALCPQHTFQILTKRPERMSLYLSDELASFRIARAIDEIEGANELGDEELRPIPGYPGYLASSHGFIYSEKRGKRRKMRPDAGEQGHMRVQLHRDDKTARRGDRLLVHRIILETFIGPAISPDIQGRHRDRNPGNNAISNLNWGDQESNWDDSKRHGTHRRYSKLTPEQASEIRRRYGLGESGAALGREFGISDTQARNIGNGKQWAISSPIEWPPGNCWLGVSCEDQKAKERIDILRNTPAAVRMLSLEPLLEDLGVLELRGVHWVICGSESGPGARPMNEDWVRSIRDQCVSSGVAFFYKQDARNGKKIPTPLLDGKQWMQYPEKASE